MNASSARPPKEDAWLASVRVCVWSLGRQRKRVHISKQPFNGSSNAWRIIQKQRPLAPTIIQSACESGIYAKPKLRSFVSFVENHNGYIRMWNVMGWYCDSNIHRHASFNIGLAAMAKMENYNYFSIQHIHFPGKAWSQQTLLTPTPSPTIFRTESDSRVLSAD